MEEAIYYIHNGVEQRGPFTLSQLMREGLRGDTMVWRTGMANWQKASEIEELRIIFQNPYNQQQQNPYNQQQQNPYNQQQQNPYNQGPAQTYGQAPYGYQQPYMQPTYGFPTGWTNWLPWAIVATVVAVVICGLLNIIFGVIGIVKANSANDAARRGDPMASQINSSAKTWTIVSLVLSGIGIIAFFFIIGLDIALF